MVASKKRAARRERNEGQAFAVVVEQMRGDFKVFGEALAGLSARVEAGFQQVDRRFEQVDQRFEQVDRRLDRLEQGVTLLKTAVLDSGREIRAVRVALDCKVDRDEVESIVERVVARSRR